MRRVTLALLPLLAGLLARPALAESWNIGVLIFRNTNATAQLDGQTVTVQATLTNPEIAALREASQAFAARVLEWSGGVAQITVAEPRVIDDPITAVDVFVLDLPENDRAWISPQRAKDELDELMASGGDVDGVIVFWHAARRRTGAVSTPPGER
jgi:hypothetical protein